VLDLFSLEQLDPRPPTGAMLEEVARVQRPSAASSRRRRVMSGGVRRFSNASTAGPLATDHPLPSASRIAVLIMIFNQKDHESM
jgi:hypothetical protein